MYIIDVSVLSTGDNLDHNILTIDGKDTFHGIGIIAVLTPRKQLGILLPRKQIAELHVKEHAEIGIVDYRFSNHARQSVKCLDLPKSPETGSRVDLYKRELSFSFQKPAQNRSRMMHILHQGQAHPGSSSIICLPMINMNSGEMTYAPHSTICMGLQQDTMFPQPYNCIGRHRRLCMGYQWVIH